MSESRSTPQLIGVVLLWLAIGILLIAPVSAAIGGFRFDVFGLPVSMRTAWRLVMAAAILSIAAMIALVPPLVAMERDAR